MPKRDVSELALLGFFLAIAVGFVARTTTFGSSSPRLFPRLTAGVIVVGVVLLLAEDRLPEPLRKIVAEPVDIVDRDEFAEYENEPSEDDDAGRTDVADVDSEPTGTRAEDGEPTGTRAEDGEPTGTRTEDGDEGESRSAAPVLDRLTSRQFTFAAIAAYVGLAHVASILVVTPLFVLLYAYWYRQPRWIAILLAALSIGICLTFMSLANAPLDRSLLLPRGIL